MASSGARTLTRVFALALLPLLLLSACARPQAAGTPAGQSTPAQGTLVVYSGRSENLVGPIFKQFEDATGIDVQVRYAGTPELAATLKEEGTRSPADIFYAQDPGGLGVMEDMFAVLPEKTLTLAPEWARSEQGKWIGITARARALVYNHTTMSEKDLPDDIWDLQDPKWKRRLGWAPTNASFQTMVSGMVVLWGKEKTERWLRGMVANEPRPYPNNVTQVQAVADGEVDVGLVNHYYLLEIAHQQGKNFKASNYYPRAGGPGALVMVSGVGILSTAKNKANAERFLEYMLSKEAQQWFAEVTFEYPLAPGVSGPAQAVPLEQINAPTIRQGELADLAGTQKLLRATGVLH